MAESLKCKVGGLAVVVDAHHRSNVGKIVHVIEQYSPSKVPWVGDDANDHFDWIVACSVPLTWKDPDGKRHRRKRGPALDSALQTIRGAGIQEQEEQQERITQKRKTPLPVLEKKTAVAV